MYYVFNKSHVGYSHLTSNKPCQDFSASYQDNERVIITCCDGHGGAQYVRSQVGSRLASEAIINVFKNIDKKDFFKANIGELQEKIKLYVLCEYNKLVEQQIKKLPLRKKDFLGLKEEEIDNIRFNPAKAFGTTLSGALFYKDKIVVISIGDTEALGIKKGELIRLFDNSNDPAGNVTYSMCQEDAYQYLRVVILGVNQLDGVILCTDGLTSPYQSYDNFNQSFVRPTVKRVLNTKSINSVSDSIERIATKLGTGDDVSLSFILKEKARVNSYAREGKR